MFAAGSGVEVWLGSTDEDWGRATIEGGDVMPIGKGVVLVGMGERTTPRANMHPGRGCSRPGRADLLLAPVVLPGRAAMHLDTVMTMVDHGAVCAYRGGRGHPGVGGASRRCAGRRRPRAAWGAGLVESMGRHLGVGEMHVVTTGGDDFEGQREQWDDSNNVLALEPGVVVAYERSTYTSTKLRKAGIEVITMPGLKQSREQRRPLRSTSNGAQPTERAGPSSSASRRAGPALR